MEIDDRSEARIAHIKKSLFGYKMKDGLDQKDAEAVVRVFMTALESPEDDSTVQYYIDWVKARDTRHYVRMIGCSIDNGKSFEEAKAKMEEFRIAAGLPENNEPAQFFIDWVNNENMGTYKWLVGSDLQFGHSLEQAKANWEEWRKNAGLPEVNKPVQYFLDWHNGLYK